VEIILILKVVELQQVEIIHMQKVAKLARLVLSLILKEREVLQLLIMRMQRDLIQPRLLLQLMQKAIMH
jgi:hypothetical protein